jgi:hypothetical protein
MTTFNKGDTVYNEHGEEAEFVTQSMGEYIVRPILEDEYGHTYRSDIETWKQAFRTPPKPKLDAETAAAEKKLTDLRAELNKLREERRAFDSEERSRQDRIKMHEELALLDDYLAGKITHYLSLEWYSRAVEIIPINETVENYPSSDGYGLLTLQPTRGWDKGIKWSVKQRTRDGYSDSRTINVIPCRSEEEAAALAVKHLTECIKKQAAQDPKERRYTEKLIANCRRFGVAIPQSILSDIENATRATLQKQIDDHIERAEKLKLELGKFQ